MTNRLPSRRALRARRLRFPENLESRRVLDSTVVFSELMYNPVGGAESGEWIELYNQMSVDMDLAGWSLGEAVDFTFPPGTKLAGGQYLVVAASPEQFSGAIEADRLFGPFERQLSNAGERIVLRNHTGRFMDELTYGDAGDWPIAADGSGATLAKRFHQAASGPAENWSFSAQLGGTPGSANVVADPVARGGLRFNEVAAAGAGFWIELQNDGPDAASLAGYRIRSTQLSTPDYVLPATQLDPGAHLVIDASQLGYVPDEGTRLFLLTPDSAEVLDGAVAGAQPQARATTLDDRWQVPDPVTPGAANQFQVASEIVISEIMYHPRPIYAQPGEYGIQEFLPLDAAWRYDQSNTDFGSAWIAPEFDDSSWSLGNGILHFEDSPLPGPKGTELVLGPLTHYFRTEFDWNSQTNAGELLLNHVVDDGAVFYLNGVEFLRFNMGDGRVGHDSRAIGTVSTARVNGPVTIPAALLREGRNTLAVEVHQNLPNSPDVVFGASLALRGEITPATPFRESDQEWIELYNRGTQPVDLSNWSLNDAVQFTFPAGTTMAPGEFVVIAASEEAVSRHHPQIRIVGEYAGQLSDRNERIQLLDQRANVVDEVHYFDGGRWPEFADGGGSSLELRDPFADNRFGEAWQVSDESARTRWHHVSYTMTVEPIVFDPPINFHEFVMGLIGPGEVLIDNIQVIEEPEVDAVPLIQNGTFENDTIGAHADKWRLVGTHQQSEVIADPDNPDNQVLRLVAEARMNYLSNHAETTLANGARVVNGRTYQISYDAKWVAGTPQLHTELYYKDAARTTILPQPDTAGTPGRPNSNWQDNRVNIGPTFDQLGHAPLIPNSTDTVTVSVQAADPDGLATIEVLYAVNGEGPYQSVPMTADQAGVFRASLPAQTDDAVVHFYVRATDQLGAESFFPAAGPDSRALYRVTDNLRIDARRQDFRVVMLPAEANLLHERTRMVDNNRWGGTAIYNNEEVFYDVGTRLKGSMFSRQNISNTGYNVRFQPDNLFRGVHDTLRFDQNGESEILVKYFTAAIGNPGGSYDDAMMFTTPTGRGGGPTLVFLAAHGDVFLDEQFENGGDGTLFKFEGIRVMQTTVDRDPESLKLYQPIGWVPQFDLLDLGDDKELYRWPFLINNNRDRDDFSRIIDMVKAFSNSGDALGQAVADVIDVDQWLSTFAIMSLFGIGDAYSQGNPHNLNFYVRPEDNRVLAFPWDWDFVFSQAPTAPLHGNKAIGRLLDLPDYEHRFYGQLHHMISTLFNRNAMEHWANHLAQMVGASGPTLLRSMELRGDYVMSELPDPVRFVIGTEAPAVISTTLVSPTGNGQVLVPSTDNGGDTLGADWIQPDFVPNDTWRTIRSSVGYQDPLATFAGSFEVDMSEMYNESVSAYLRVPFELNEDPATLDRLKLFMKFDDGFVAYLNGVRVAAENAPDDPAWDTVATRSQRNADAVEFAEYDLSSWIHLLRPGQNVLALHGMNRLASSNDFLLTPQLVAERFPEVETPRLTTDEATITLTGRGWVDVQRIRIAGQTDTLPLRWTEPLVWQTEVPLQPGLNQLTLEALDLSGNVVDTARVDITSGAVRPVLEHLRITEIMYHASAPSAMDVAQGFDNDDAFDYLELVNTSATETLQLDGVRIADGVEFTFPAMELPPGQHVVVVDSPEAFALRYGAVPVAGAYARSLSNAGETIRLLDATGAEVLAVTYADSDPWPESADGDGMSLELRSATGTPVDQLSSAAVWQAAAPTPGRGPGAIPGDLNADGQTNAADIDLLCAAILADETVFDPRLDLNGDGQLTTADHAHLIDQILQVVVGDANLDGVFNSRDLVLIFQAGEYEDDQPRNSSWADGDWNCDGEFSSRDLVAAFQAGRYQQ